jgi:hypothetical protein
MSYFQIGVTELPDPSEFQSIPFLIEKAQRLAGGDLVADKITHKHNFVIGWSWMYDTDYATLYNQYVSDDMFFTFTYWDRGSVRTATTRITSLDGQLSQIRGSGDDVYLNVTANLEEQ